MLGGGAEPKTEQSAEVRARQMKVLKENQGTGISMETGSRKVKNVKS